MREECKELYNNMYTHKSQVLCVAQVTFYYSEDYKQCIGSEIYVDTTLIGALGRGCLEGLNPIALVLEQ